MSKLLRPIQNFIKKHYLWGLFLVAISFLVWLIPKEYHSLTVTGGFFSIFCLGCILFFDGLDYKLSGSSLLINNKNVNFLKTFGLASVLGGVILDLFANAIAKKYYYPLFTPPVYFLIFAPGFIFYFVVIAESYFACKSILDRYMKRPLVKKGNPKLLKVVHILILVLGFVGIAYSLYYYHTFHSEAGDFVLSTMVRTSVKTNIYVIMLLATSVWLIFEAIGFFLNKQMLITFLCRGYFRPLLATLLACVVLSIPMEIWNVPIDLWTYINVPLDHIQIFKVPLFVYLSWPFHYLPFLSLYLLVSKDAAEVPYELDNIKTP